MKQHHRATAFEPAPTTLDHVISPEWLSGMLSTRWPGTVVEQVTVIETLATQATKVRLALVLNGAGPNVPTRICVKGVLTPTGALSTASVIETKFYRDCADWLPVHIPHCIYAALNEAGDNGVVVMKDLIDGGAKFLSALVPFTPNEATESIEQLARLHVAGAAGSPLYELPWIPCFIDQMTARPMIALDILQDLLDGPRGLPLPTAVRSAERLKNALEQLATQVHALPKVTLHGDSHAGNIFRDAAGIGLVDWQILQKGNWAQDVAYHLAAVLSPEDRRAHERALLDHYRDRLVALGGPEIEAEHAWTRYRSAMIYGFYLWAMTRKVQPDITNEFVRRLGIAVSDLDSFEAVGR